MSQYIITCVCKENNGNIAGVGCLGLYFFKTQTVIDMIKKGDTFHTKDQFGKTAQVHIFWDRFIKTAADNKWTDNLDGLPTCQDCHLCK